MERSLQESRPSSLKVWGFCALSWVLVNAQMFKSPRIYFEFISRKFYQRGIIRSEEEEKEEEELS